MKYKYRFFKCRSRTIRATAVIEKIGREGQSQRGVVKKVASVQLAWSGTFARGTHATKKFAWQEARFAMQVVQYHEWLFGDFLDGMMKIQCCKILLRSKMATFYYNLSFLQEF